MPGFFAIKKKEVLPDSAARRIFALISSDLSRVETEFERQARSNIQVIGYLGEYLRSSGGKRLRPALLLLTNRAAGGECGDNVVRLAAVMEMLHTATLVHDDIIDNADIRRSKPSINARYGNQTAVLMGDWLYMSAFETALSERSLEILDILTGLTRKMTEGELIQMTMIGRVDITEEDHLDILRRKTAYLFSACCEIGAILAGADNDVRLAMRSFGLDLGIAFQLADDLLDLTGDDDTLGKAAGADLLEGKLTLPLISLIKVMPSLRDDLESIMLNGRYDKLSRESLMLLLKTHGIIDSIKKREAEHTSRAIKSLEVLAKNEYRSALEQIPGILVDRKK